MAHATRQMLMPGCKEATAVHPFSLQTSLAASHSFSYVALTAFMQSAALTCRSTSVSLCRAFAEREVRCMDTRRWSRVSHTSRATDAIYRASSSLLSRLYHLRLSPRDSQPLSCRSSARFRAVSCIPPVEGYSQSLCCVQSCWTSLETAPWHSRCRSACDARLQNHEPTKVCLKASPDSCCRRSVAAYCASFFQDPLACGNATS